MRILKQERPSNPIANLRDEVIKKLLDAHKFEVPQSLVDEQTKHRLEGVARQMIGRGVDPRNREIDWEARARGFAGAG